jgi:hypothetical protein
MSRLLAGVACSCLPFRAASAHLQSISATSRLTNLDSSVAWLIARSARKGPDRSAALRGLASLRFRSQEPDERSILSP